MNKLKISKCIGILKINRRLSYSNCVYFRQESIESILGKDCKLGVFNLEAQWVQSGIMEKEYGC